MGKPTIIGLSAQLQNGKDTVAALILKLTSYTVESGEYTVPSKWKTRRFAGKLKEMTAILLGCSVDALEDINYKNTELPDEWSRWSLIDPGLVTETDDGRVTPHFATEQEVYDYIKEKEWFWLENLKPTKETMTPRKILQLLGTEGGRDVIHPNIWVNATLGDLTEKDHVIITDARFPNEVIGINRKGGIVVKIIRPSVVSTSNHPSETSLNNYTNWDYTIINDGTLEELEAKVEKMLLHFNII